MPKRWFFLLLAGSLLIASMAVGLAVKQYRDKKQLADVVTAEISDQLVRLVPALLKNDELLQHFLLADTTEMAPEVAADLCYNFETIGHASQRLSELASGLQQERLTQLGGTSLFSTGSVAQDIQFHLGRQVLGNDLLGDCRAPAERLSLDDEQMENMKRIGRLSEAWGEIAAAYEGEMSGREPFAQGDLVNEPDWVEMLVQLAADSADLQINASIR